MTIIWTLNCFFMLYTWPTKQVFCLYLRRILDNKSFWMSLKSTFLAFKKSCWPNWGEGRKGGNLDKIQKNSNIFLWYRPLMWLSMMIMLIMIKCWSSQPRKQEQRYKGYNVYKHEKEDDYLFQNWRTLERGKTAQKGDMQEVIVSTITVLAV